MAVTTDLPRTPHAELLHWDTEFWGTRIGRANYAGALDEWARENTIGCMCLLIPATDVEDAARAEAHGARFVDVRVQLDRRLPANWVTRDIEEFVPPEVNPLAEIARTAFRGTTRFYADPIFDDARCDDLYESWLRSSCDGWAQAVLAARDREGPCGFVTVHLDDDVASIGLIAVAERARGRGLGVDLCRAAQRWAFDADAKRMTVVTQGRNLAAQRTFQRAGFLTCDTAIWFHHWYGGKPAAPPANPSNVTRYG